VEDVVANRQHCFFGINQSQWKHAHESYAALAVLLEVICSSRDCNANGPNAHVLSEAVKKRTSGCRLSIRVTVNNDESETKTA
jgi:hypothetical protein